MLAVVLLYAQDLEIFKWPLHNQSLLYNALECTQMFTEFCSSLQNI
jgi:hypothetical protein